MWGLLYKDVSKIIINKADVMNKLDALKAYSVAAEPATAALFAPVYAAVNAYFNADNSGLVAALEDVVKYMYNDISRRTTVYENNFDMHLATDYPQGYDDISKCFYQFSELLTVTDSSFFAAFIYGVPEGAGSEDDGAAEEIPLSNPYLDRWTAEITAAITGDLANVQALAEWCKNSGGCCDLVCLLENRGRTLSYKTVREIAEVIYNDRLLLAVASARNLKIYVPTYLRG